MNPVPILLLLGSLALLVIEVIVVSFGAIALMAIGCDIGGIMLAFDESALYGWTMIGTLIVGGPLCVRGAFAILPKIPFARGFYLRAPDLTEADRHAADQTDSTLMGRKGHALSPLRPAGTAEFAGTPQDVITRGGMVERGGAVRVVEISGNRVIVEPIETSKINEPDTQ
jgi:membrane-bound serine protease (ClpP class)